MSSTKEKVKNAIKKIEITDYIMLIRGECMTVILVEDFIKDITFGGSAVCDTLLNCWKTMGQFDGGSNPDNGDDDPCNCNDDFVKIHFPKGEGIKVITDESKAVKADSIYIVPVGQNQYKQIIVDEEGNARTPVQPVIPEPPVIDYPVIDGENINAASTENGVVNIFKQLSNKKLQFKGLEFKNLKVTDLPNGNVEVAYVATVDETIKQFYVNEKYNNPNADGTILKPFKSILDALLAVIGTGTALQPQFTSTNVILQTSVSVTQSQLDNIKYSKLKGRLTVNSTRIFSENNSTINWFGNLTPFSTKFLKEEATANNNWTGSRYFLLDNITCFSNTVVRLIEIFTFKDSVDHRVYLNNISVNSITNAELYTELQYTSSPSASNNWGDSFFENKVHVESSIPVTDAVIYIEGTNAITNLSNLSIKGYLSISFSNQTGIKMVNSTVIMDELRLYSNPTYRSVATTSSVQDRGIKSGLYGIEISNSWCYIPNGIKIDGDVPRSGGLDSIIKYTGDYSFPNSTVNINGIYVHNEHCNSIFRLNQSPKPVGYTAPTFVHDISNITGNITLSGKSIKGSIFNEQAELVTIGIDGSRINGVKHQNISYVLLSSGDISFINGQPFINLNYYDSQTSAQNAGLLPGSLYFSADNNVRRVSFYTI